MNCKNCKYKGMYLKHLDNYDPDTFSKEKKGNKWYNCDYPLPIHAHTKAVMEHWGEGCKVYIKKSELIHR